MSSVPGDQHVFEVVNGWSRDTAWLHGAAKLYAGQGALLFGALLVAGYLVARRRDALAVARSLLAGAGVLLAVAVNQPIVAAFDAPRPYTELPHALVLVHRSTDPSFPSDHATMAGAVAVGLYLLDRRLGILAGALALLMAFTRVYVGAHFPSDVLAGLLLGGVVAAALQLLAPKVALLLERLARGPLRPLVTAR